MADILCANNINKSFGDKKVLAGVNVTLAEGELVALLGASGCGKTTLLNILSGLLEPDEGAVTIGGHDITGKTGQMAYMQQKDLLLDHKKVIDNVALPLRLSGLSKKEAREAATPYLETFGLSGTEFQYPAQLSGGMRQRAALLRTYLCKKPVALLDEPFGALDMITRKKMQSWYLDVMDKICLSTILVTHDVDEAILLADRVLILAGSPATVVNEIIIDAAKPRHEEFLLSDAFLSYKRMISSEIVV